MTFLTHVEYNVENILNGKKIIHKKMSTTFQGLFGHERMKCHKKLFYCLRFDIYT